MNNKSGADLKILVVKTSSMGDVIHTLPAITDLAAHYPNAKIDWVVEQGFVELAQAHPAINEVIPISLRKWRKNLFCRSTIVAIKRFNKQLHATTYDYIIDAQGLLKSAVITRLAKTKVSKSFGLDSASSRGKHLAWAYDQSFSIPKKMHAVNRIKLLFSKIFGYEYQANIVDYGLSDTKKNITDYGLNNTKEFNEKENGIGKQPYLVFLHCTTWESKKWPVPYWRELIKIALENGYHIKLNSGNEKELAAARVIADGFDELQVEVMQPQSIERLKDIIANSKGVVSVDTGLGHLAAALGVQGVGIYGATDPKLTSMLSDNFTNLKVDYKCSPCLLHECNKLRINEPNPPCYSTLLPTKVWKSLNLADI